MATIDIRDYGAQVDGSSDDTGAVMDAVRAASPGDTVYFPRGTTGVFSSGGAAIDLDGGNAAGLTFAGDGEDSVIKMLGGVESGRNAWIVGVDGGGSNLTGFTIRDLVLDGNRSNNPAFTTFGFNMYPGGTGHDITIRDVRAQNCSESGFTTWGGHVEFDRCTAVNNGRQGFGISPSADTTDPEVVLRDVLVLDNDKVGIDHNSGVALVDGFWAENNGQGGAKVPWGVKESTWRNGTLKSNGTMGFRYNGDYSKQQYRPFTVHLDDVVAADNPWAGFWFSGDVDYDIGTIAAVGNNTTGRQHGNIDVHSLSDLSADAVYSSGAEGSGLFYSSDRSSEIGTYHHGDNSGGSLTGDQRSNLTVTTDRSGSPPTVDVPSKAELGAWSSSEESADVALSTDSGAFMSDRGALETR